MHYKRTIKTSTCSAWAPDYVTYTPEQLTGFLLKAITRTRLGLRVRSYVRRNYRPPQGNKPHGRTEQLAFLTIPLPESCGFISSSPFLYAFRPRVTVYPAHQNVLPFVS